MTASRFCKDCKWHKPARGGIPDLCTHAKSLEQRSPPRVDVVTGETEKRDYEEYPCEVMREFHRLCGHDAIYFEAKP